MNLETKDAGGMGLSFDGVRLEGYASLFDVEDSGGDVMAPGAFTDGLAAMAAEGRRVKMLWVT